MQTMDDMMEMIRSIREHFEDEHGIDYSVEAIVQMVTNRGYSLDSLKYSNRNAHPA